MLPARHRLRRSAEFRAATRGRRAAGRLIVIHATPTDADARRGVRVGFVVSKVVGNAVHRNRTKRRLRAVAGEVFPELPGGIDIVVRARPGSADATYADLLCEVRDLLPRVLRPKGQGRPRGPRTAPARVDTP